VTLNDSVWAMAASYPGSELEAVTVRCCHDHRQSLRLVLLL
jgi:hypothetical protein